MIMNRVNIIFVIMVVMFARQTQGDDSQKLALAYSLVEKTNMSKMFVDLAESFMQNYFERYERPGVENQMNANPLQKVFNDEVAQGEDELKWMLAEIYATHFTENELKHITIFFNSPAGKAWLDRRPIIESDGEQLGLEWGRLLTQRVLKRFELQTGEKF
ncbi:MAG: DUF2059 domain-containing protein [Desulfobacterales bacterium]|jgi:hypothetical protein